MDTARTCKEGKKRKKDNRTKSKEIIRGVSTYNNSITGHVNWNVTFKFGFFTRTGEARTVCFCVLIKNLGQKARFCLNSPYLYSRGMEWYDKTSFLDGAVYMLHIAYHHFCTSLHNNFLPFFPNFYSFTFIIPNDVPNLKWRTESWRFLSFWTRIFCVYQSISLHNFKFKFLQEVRTNWRITRISFTLRPSEVTRN